MFQTPELYHAKADVFTYGLNKTNPFLNINKQNSNDKINQKIELNHSTKK